jgi:hypothetical protein
MAKPVPRAGKTEAGGAKVILSSVRTYAASYAATALPGNPIPALKKKRSKFTCIDLLFCVRALMVSGHRFPDEEILAIDTTFDRLSARTSSKEDAGLDGSNNGRAVTTNHLLLPPLPRSAAFCCRLGYGFQNFCTVRPGGTGGGERPPRMQREASIQKHSRNFIPNKRTPQFA